MAPFTPNKVASMLTEDELEHLLALAQNRGYDQGKRQVSTVYHCQSCGREIAQDVFCLYLACDCGELRPIVDSE